jgi:hypothetical protein
MVVHRSVRRAIQRGQDGLSNCASAFVAYMAIAELTLGQVPPDYAIGKSRAGCQPLCRFHFEGTLNRYVVEEKFYCVLPNYQVRSKDPNRRKMNFVFLKNDLLFRTFNHRLTFGISK